MGYDAYGLPAEQYAIQTGQHPAVTTAANINRYREQLDKIGFCFDWDREVRTCDPAYYHWTQWAFQKMFDSYYCNDRQQARPIEELIKAFDKKGTESLNVACSEELRFTADEWKAMDEKETAGDAHELPHRLFGRNDGELVSETRYGVGQRRGSGRRERTRRLSRRSEKRCANGAYVSVHTPNAYWMGWIRWIGRIH